MSRLSKVPLCHFKIPLTPVAMINTDRLWVILFFFFSFSPCTSVSQNPQWVYYLFLPFLNCGKYIQILWFQMLPWNKLSTELCVISFLIIQFRVMIMRLSTPTWKILTCMAMSDDNVQNKVQHSVFLSAK